jgi:hypothetical protein
MALDLTNNAIAERRFTFMYGRIYPNLDDEELRECWAHFCVISARDPQEAADFEFSARRESRMPLDS